MPVEKVDELFKKYGIAIRFSNGIEPYVTFKIGKKEDKEIISKVKEFLNLVVKE